MKLKVAPAIYETVTRLTIILLKNLSHSFPKQVSLMLKLSFFSVSSLDFSLISLADFEELVFFPPSSSFHSLCFKKGKGRQGKGRDGKGRAGEAGRGGAGRGAARRGERKGKEQGGCHFHEPQGQLTH